MLGKGTYGVVYAGRERHTRVRIAIKEIPERDSRCGVLGRARWGAGGRDHAPRGSCGHDCSVGNADALLVGLTDVRPARWARACGQNGRDQKGGRVWSGLWAGS